MFLFGGRSKANLDTCHPTLQTVAMKALERSDVDFSITEGFRLPSRQMSLYAQGREKINGIWRIVDGEKVVTHIDGDTEKGKHNMEPSHAFDVSAYVPGKPELAYDVKLLSYIAGVISSVAKELKEDGSIVEEVFWGGWWKSFQDLPHYQLDL